MRIRLLWTSLLCILLLFGGCGIQNVEEGEREAAEYTVVKVGEIPVEVEAMIREQGSGAFEMAYESGGYLYVLKGYGEQKSGGFSIRVEEVYWKGAMLHVKTELIGPAVRESQKGGVSCPYLVLKLEAQEESSVVFEE